MCGVLGFVSQNDRQDMGRVASRLLKMLEYRGYDSTGAVIQDQSGQIILRKDVGSPTHVTAALNIPELTGNIFCGQVRWATFGTVTRDNAQPHEVKCHTHLYGAHNGNVTNCEPLKDWLKSEGHQVVSDNDGEMLVHTVEHFFARELTAGNASDTEFRRGALHRAIVAAGTRMIGSYAAVVVDPVTGTMACIKAGSSLYMGLGQDPEHGSFLLVSSDLSAVLSHTRLLIPIREKEFAIFGPDWHRLHSLKDGTLIDRPPLRSRLRVEETELKAPYKYFMEQEIFAQENAARRLIRLYTGQSPLLTAARRLLAEQPDRVKNLKHHVSELAEVTDPGELRQRAGVFAEAEELTYLRNHMVQYPAPADDETGLESTHAPFLEELDNLVPDSFPRDCIRMLDAVFLLDETDDLDARVRQFVDRMVRAHEYGSAVYLMACGTSFHAAKTATQYFDRIAGLPLQPLLPGEFRAQCSHSLRRRDVVIGISQSGETKDLIDVFHLARDNGRDVSLISIVNNTNSSLAQEHSELYIPLYCGPEIAVPATKSFLNQLLVLYILALRVARRFVELGIRRVDPLDLKRREDELIRIPGLIRQTLESTKEAVEKTAACLEGTPSMHILATGMLGIAKEGALKIREVVLNHTEGFEGSEFKHGPNTILGVNTVYGIDSIAALMNTLLNENGENPKQLEESIRNLLAGVQDQGQTISPGLSEALYSHYPLLFVTGPEERDVHLTVSQINTHKIRGADIFMIAEPNDLLLESIRRVPDSERKQLYRSTYIQLPITGDAMLATFTSTVVLQHLALRMSIRKMQRLDRLNLPGHGVHPDSPKNVSKSITVD